MTDNAHAQKTFDKVAKHLLTQNAKAMRNEFQCCYLAPDGKKCAVGCLIPSDVYESEMEGKNVDTLLERYSQLKRILLRAEVNLLVSLQVVHDDHFVSNWPIQLNAVAASYHLKPYPRQK